MIYFCYMRTVLSICMSLCALFLMGSGRDLRFMQIGVDEGLSHATVAAIGQDSRGYIWIATPDGLNRYDGYTFRTYRHDDKVASSIASNDLHRIALDTNGVMWIASRRHLSRYNPTFDNFNNFALDREGNITDIMPVDENTVLVGTTRGLLTFDIPSGTFTLLRPEGFGDKSVVSLSRNDEKVFISAGRNGLYSLDLASKKANRFPIGDDIYVAQTLPLEHDLLAGTEGAGVFRLDPSTGTVKAHYRFGGSEGLGSDYVRSMELDSEGKVWVGTFTGLDIFDADNQKFDHYDAGWGNPSNISHSSVRRIFADNQGGMWLGTFFGGLNYYHPLRNQFATLRHSNSGSSLNDNVMGVITESPDGKLWIGTNSGGVNIYSPRDDSFEYITMQEGLPSNDVKAIYIDEENGLTYIGTHLGGLNIYDSRSRRVRNVKGVPENVYSIIPSRKKGFLWLAALDNLVLFDTKTGKAVKVSANGLSRVTDLYRDDKGLLWVSGEDGVSAFTEDAEGVITLAPNIPDDINTYRGPVNSVFKSRDGINYYFATHEGLKNYDSSSGKTRLFDTSAGMPNNIVYGVLEDANGNLWCSTNKGLAVLNPSTGDIRSYSQHDGLQGNQFTNKSFINASDGRFYFGGINGLTYFNPSRLEVNPYSPQPIIAGLRLFNIPVSPGDETGLLKRAVSETPKIVFKPDQSSFTIDYTVCNYTAGGRNTFSYLLEGVGKQWTTTTENSPVTFSNLPAGNYRFRLRSANNDAVWSDNEAVLDIEILPRWYDYWWVKILFILLVLLLAGAFIAYLWQRNTRRQLDVLAARDRERQNELNEMKVTFFINMSHELRTPLTLILLPIQELLQQATDKRTRQKLTIVKNNAERILHIVNQLLDYRRAEMGMFRLKTQPLDINTAIEKVFENYEFQASRMGIEMKLDLKGGESPVSADPRYLELICNNLLSNALKYTPAGGTVNLTVDKTVEEGAEVVKIIVADTGCGIPADKLSDIFNRFYMVDERPGGSGIGLSLVKRLVEQHHGTITVKSELGKGSEFTVTLPASQEAYSEEERQAHPSLEISGPKPPLDLPEDVEYASYSAGDNDVADQNPASEGEDEADIEIEGTRETVLVVDDNSDIRKYICEGLAGEFNVIPAVDGAHAIEILSARNVDLIITDIMMPDIDGVQLCRTVKRNLRTSHIPVIMLSAKGELPDQVEGFKVGADDYMVKPFSMELLLSKVKNSLRTRRMAISRFSSTAEIKPEEAAMNPLDEEFLRKALAVMQEHLDDPDFSTDAYAREMCMSRSNLHLKMKALTGESTNEFIRSFRMKKAMELLKSGRYTISQVSSMVGYLTASYFTTSFKKYYGELPSSIKQ